MRAEGARTPISLDFGGREDVGKLASRGCTRRGGLGQGSMHGNLCIAGYTLHHHLRVSLTISSRPAPILVRG